MQKLFTSLLLLSFSTFLIAKDTKKTDQILFEKTKKYIQSTDKNTTLKKELNAYVGLTGKLLKSGDLADGLAYIRMKDCVQKHNTGLEVERLEELIQQEINDNNMTKAYKAGQEKILWWLMTMGMKASAGESNKDDIKKMFECGNTSKIASKMDLKNIEGAGILSAGMPKQTPSSAGDKSIIFENFIRKMLENPIKKLNNAKAIELGIVPKNMIKNGQIISSEGAKVTLKGVWGKGLMVTYKGISSTPERRESSPCSRLVMMNSDFGPRINGKSYPAPDTVNINRKVFYLPSTSTEQIQEACKTSNPAEVIITLRDYTKEDRYVLKPSEWKFRKYKTVNIRHTRSVAVSPNKKLYAFGETDDLYIHMKDKLLRKVPFFSASYITFLKDKETILAARGRGEIVLIDILTGKILKTIWETKGISDAAISPDEKFVSIVNKGELRIIDIEKGTTHKILSVPAKKARYSESPSLTSIAYSPDGKTIYMGGYSDSIISYDVENDIFGEPIEIRNARIINAFSFIDNKTMLVGGDNFLAKIDLSTRSVAKYKPLKGRRNISIKSMDLSPSGRYLASAGSPSIVFDLKRVEVVDRLGGRGAGVDDMEFITDKTFISASGKHIDAVNFWRFK